MLEPEEQHEPGAGGYVLIIALMLLTAVIAVLVAQATGAFTPIGGAVSNL